MRIVSSSGSSRLVSLCCAVASLCIALSSPATAQSKQTQDEVPPIWRETWAGVDAARDVWLIYSGMTIAPMGSIHSAGLRMRVAGGYGAYTYYSSGTSTDPTPVLFKAKTTFTDALIGYLWRFGDLTAKAFVGGSMISHNVNVLDENSVVQGSQMGAKGVIELWLNIGAKSWGSMDVSWAEAHQTRSAHMRLGTEIGPGLSLGAEAALNVDAQAECRIRGEASGDCPIGFNRTVRAPNLLDYARGGVFLRKAWAEGEASVSAGVLGSSLREGDGLAIQPYVTFSVLSQF